MSHHSIKKLRTRRLAMEGLEPRTLMAGNVTATVDASGLLSVNGDNADNLIYLRQLPSTPSATWQGYRYSIETWTPRYKLPTTINGQSAAIVEGVKNVNIAMKDGGDHVYVGNPNRSGGIANLPGTVNIDMGRNYNPDESVNEKLTLRIENHQKVNVNLGTGSDWLAVLGTVHALNVQGDPVFQAGDPPGDDHISLQSLKMSGPVAIDSKYGNDEVVLLNESSTTNSNATVTVLTGSGNDRVSVAIDNRLKSALRIDAGSGDDFVLITRLQEATVVSVNTGQGNDYVNIEFSPTVFNRLAVWLGAGNDHLYLSSIKSLKTVLGGGDGTDTLNTYQDYPNDLGDETITGFEILAES